MKKELRVECLSSLLALKNALKKQDNKTANDIEALQLINVVIEVISNDKKEGMAINFALSRFYGGFSRIVGLQGMVLSQDTSKHWNDLKQFFNGDQLKDYRLGGVVVGLS